MLSVAGIVKGGQTCPEVRVRFHVVGTPSSVVTVAYMSATPIRSSSFTVWSTTSPAR